LVTAGEKDRMKAEVEIVTVTDGEIREVKLFDALYVLEQKKIQSNGLDKGKRLGMCGHVAIYENIANEIKQTNNHADAEKVVKKYYPTYAEISARTTATTYRRHVRLVNGDTSITPELTRMYRRRHKRKPSNAVAFVKTYGTWVKVDSVTKVKQAIHKFAPDYKPTFRTILEETKLSKGQLLSTLRHLKDQGEINAVRQKNLEIVYQPIIRVGEV